MAVDWRKWHEYYDDPTRSLGRRLDTVRSLLAQTLGRCEARRPVLLSVCAGDGRDTLPVLADGFGDTRAVLIELDPQLARTARESARLAGLHGVEVRTADAGSLATYAGVPPADVLVACGVFGNITDHDLERTIAGSVHLLARDGAVIWTRGDRSDPRDPSDYRGDPSEFVRELFARHGHDEEAFVRPADADFRVGVHRRTARVPSAGAVDGPVLFTFTR